MNYANDALWWYFFDKDVRNLAMILTSPPTMNHQNELPIKLLLGDNGFRYLKKLDSQPEKLRDFLADLKQDYARSLLIFWFKNASHIHLIDEENLVILIASKQYKVLFSCENIISGSLKHKQNNENAVYISRGNVFAKSDEISNAWCGILLDNKNEITQYLDENSKFANVLENDLAPLLKTNQECKYFVNFTLTSNCFARLKQRPDGYWYEDLRFLVRNTY